MHTLPPLVAAPPRRVSPLLRAADLLAGGLLLVLTAPLLAVIAIAVRVTSHGPVFHREPVTSDRGNHRDLLSFRTLVDGAGTDTHERLRAVVGADSGTPYTTLGPLLERTRLARLPRLVNVVGGSASFFN
jgi:lipopolysaccharide/colanic/teichoic acid biosynthesis glycosyltransferase